MSSCLRARILETKDSWKLSREPIPWCRPRSRRRVIEPLFPSRHLCLKSKCKPEVAVPYTRSIRQVIKLEVNWSSLPKMSMMTMTVVICLTSCWEVIRIQRWLISISRPIDCPCGVHPKWRGSKAATARSLRYSVGKLVIVMMMDRLRSLMVRRQMRMTHLSKY